MAGQYGVVFYFHFNINGVSINKLTCLLMYKIYIRNILTLPLTHWPQLIKFYYLAMKCFQRMTVNALKWWLAVSRTSCWLGTRPVCFLRGWPGPWVALESCWPILLPSGFCCFLTACNYQAHSVLWQNCYHINYGQVTSYNWVFKKGTKASCLYIYYFTIIGFYFIRWHS